MLASHGENMQHQSRPLDNASGDPFEGIRSKRFWPVHHSIIVESYCTQPATCRAASTCTVQLHLAEQNWAMSSNVKLAYSSCCLSLNVNACLLLC